MLIRPDICGDSYDECLAKRNECNSELIKAKERVKLLTYKLEHLIAGLLWYQDHKEDKL